MCFIVPSDTIKIDGVSHRMPTSKYMKNTVTPDMIDRKFKTLDIIKNP